RAVPVTPARDGLAPLAGDFGEHVEARPHILAALGIVRRGRGEGPRPALAALRELFVQERGRQAETVGVAADLVERQEAVELVERRVLDPLGDDGRRYLLELAGEAALFGPVGIVGPTRLRRLLQQRVADEVEQR